MRIKKKAKYDKINYMMSNNFNNVNPNNFNFGNTHPNNFNQKIRNNVIYQNIYHAGHGNYKICHINGSIKFVYKGNYNPGAIDTICKVYVHNKHPIEIVDRFAKHGINNFAAREPIPMIMYPLGREFLGTNFESREGIYDENVILRTNYAHVVKKQTNIFPIKKDSEVIYSSPITVIRDINYNFLSHDNIFKMGVATICPSTSIDLIEVEQSNDQENKVNKKNKETKDYNANNNVDNNVNNNANDECNDRNNFNGSNDKSIDSIWNKNNIINIIKERTQNVQNDTNNDWEIDESDNIISNTINSDDDWEIDDDDHI